MNSPGNQAPPPLSAEQESPQVNSYSPTKSESTDTIAELPEDLASKEATEAQAKQLELPWVESPSPASHQHDFLRQVLPVHIALQQQVLPLELVDLSGNTITEPATAEQPCLLKVASAKAFDLTSKQLVVHSQPHALQWCLSPTKALQEALQQFYGIGADTFEAILAGRDFDPSSLEEQDETSVLDEDDDEASVIKFVNQILRDGLEQRATDIHFEPLSDSLRIRYRIDGVLQESPVPPNIRALQSSVIARLKIMAKLDIAEKRLPQDGRIHLQSNGQDIDVRVATIPTVEGESISLRLLNQERYTLDRLGLFPKERALTKELLGLSNGIILVTGPTGSGKSTSLYTFLSQLNTPGKRIVTIEDPVENKLPGVMQIAVRPEIGLSFAAGLRSILRGDPNIVMVGEIRDLETAEIAIRASLTGHLVFSTLHTNDAIGGIHRLIDMGCEPFLVAASVRAFLAQRLVRKLCSHCSIPHQDLQHDLLDSLGVPQAGRKNIRQATGCSHCRNTGYLGRIAIYEIVRVSRKLSDAISQNKNYNELSNIAQAEDCRWLRDYGWNKVLEGETTLDEVIAATAHGDE